MEKDYKNTLNLPKTDLPMKAGLPNKEPEILFFWDSINLYNLIREKMLKKINLSFTMARHMQMAIFILATQ
ncbi:MAG: hypothetical protein Ct9H90mP6_02290 [Gammaproteobacteria bacterium]|nr:MAG: hypothetical protein Ct9H90mP6_02290 [Gammaproteobacteria bacterium]